MCARLPLTQLTPLSAVETVSLLHQIELQRRELSNLHSALDAAHDKAGKEALRAASLATELHECHRQVSAVAEP